MKVRQYYSNLPIGRKLTLIYFMSALFILAVNIFVYANVNRVVSRLDRVYISNINLNELSAALDLVQNTMKEYLDTKATDAMDGYYKAYQEYDNQIEELSDEISSEEPKRMERNIRHMSKKYLLLTNEAIEARRGRNVEKYSRYYDEASTLHRYIRTAVNSLNNERFRSNSADYSLLSVSFGYVEIVNIVVFVGIMLINVLLMSLIVNRVTRPLAALANAAEHVAKGDYDVKVERTGTLDETGVLNEAFVGMLEGIKHGVVMEAHLKDAQLKFLQAQINPHFLFNTLNAGAQLAMMEEADRTYEYIQNVADFFRYNTKKLEQPVTLAEEIRMVDTYIYIINIRFSGEIGYDKDIDESLLSVTLPAMILQPLAENAVQHGIRDIPGEGRISLKVYRDGDYCIISIFDNGAGMSEEEIDRVYRGKEAIPDSDGEPGGVGLHNVMGRLRLTFDNEDVFKVSSPGKGQGTTVTLKLPI